MRLDYVERSSIIVGERYRKEFKKIEELAESIKSYGIIQPLAVLMQDGGYLLLAGERRFRAAELAEVSSIPVHVYEELPSELRMREIEAEENFQREDMTWQEKALLLEELHRLKQEIYGPARQGIGDGWGVKQTAKLANASVGKVQQELTLARALRETPELFEGCKNKREAEKTLAKLEEALILSELAQRIDDKDAIEELNPTTGAMQRLMDSFIVGDFFDGVAQLPNASFDCVELDPDFGIDVKEFRGNVASDQAYMQIEKLEFPPIFLRVLHELHRVLKPNGWVMCWYGFEWTGFVIQAFKDVGFQVSNTPGIWVKDRVTGISNQPYMNLDPQTELFMLARKGSPSLNRPGHTNVFVSARIPTEIKIHPFERPLNLMKEIMNVIGLPGARWLVPFLGSGKTLLAAHHLRMPAIGFELSKEYKDAFTVRLHQQADQEWRL